MKFAAHVVLASLVFGTSSSVVGTDVSSNTNEAKEGNVDNKGAIGDLDSLGEDIALLKLDDKAYWDRFLQQGSVPSQQPSRQPSNGGDDDDDDGDFSVAVRSQVRFSGAQSNADFRNVDAAFFCTNDMIRQTFTYLGGGCATAANRGNPQGYNCQTFEGGPGTVSRRIEILQGDYFDDINSGDTIGQIRSRIGGSNFDNSIIYRNSVNPGGTINPNPFRSTIPGGADRNFLTYIVLQDSSSANARVRMAATWRWACTGTGTNTQYELFDVFGNAGLRTIISNRFGTIQSGQSSTDSRIRYTITNNIDEQGQIRETDRQICSRDCGATQYTCTGNANTRECVRDGRLQGGCSAQPNTNNPVRLNEETIITDNYDRNIANRGKEYRVRLRDTTVRYGGTDETSALVEEFFDFCD